MKTRSMAAARDAGNYYVLEVKGGSYTTYDFPSAESPEEAAAMARESIPLGFRAPKPADQKVTVYRALPGDRIGCRMLEEVGVIPLYPQSMEVF
jgi:hypothetical protein